MTVEITTISEEKLLVNDKLVYIDKDGDWVAKIELTQTETIALQSHIKHI